MPQIKELQAQIKSINLLLITFSGDKGQIASLRAEKQQIEDKIKALTPLSKGLLRH